MMIHDPYSNIGSYNVKANGFFPIFNVSSRSGDTWNLSIRQTKSNRKGVFLEKSPKDRPFVI